ncbi:MAG: GAF domain-containing protein [Elusimicrobiota bacterium]|nr:GAF domain-containing protein [Elusimicrobiota bacterium]
MNKKDIENKLKKKKKKLDVLSRISQTIVSNNYLHEILNLIVVMTAEIMESKICSIMLFDEKNNELVISATQSLSREYRDKPNLKVGQSVSGRVISSRQPITVKDVTRDSGYMYPELARKEGIVSMLAAPMMVKEKIIGVLNSYTDTPREFTEEEIKILQAIANQAAVAIENTRLNEEILKAKEDIKTRKILSRAKGILMKDMGITEEEEGKWSDKKEIDVFKKIDERDIRNRHSGLRHRAVNIDR